MLELSRKEKAKKKEEREDSSHRGLAFSLPNAETFSKEVSAVTKRATAKEKCDDRLEEVQENIERLSDKILKRAGKLQARENSLYMVSSQISHNLQELDHEVKKEAHIYTDEKLIVQKTLELDQNYLEMEDIFDKFKVKARLIRGPIGEAVSEIVSQMGALLSDNGMQARELYALVSDNIESHSKKEEKYTRFTSNIRELQSTILDISIDSELDE